jgi:hypothetical protein
MEITMILPLAFVWAGLAYLLWDLMAPYVRQDDE